MRLIIDTDAGVDDAQAIMLALAHPGVTVEAITTVTGNVIVDKVIPNVFTVLDLMGADVPVYRGAELPLLPGFWQPEERIHGTDGLGDYRHRSPLTRQVEALHAALALVQMADAAPGDLTLVALGPLTNIAVACKLDPDFPHKIGQFVFMGGTLSAMGNTEHLTAEFNFYCDPEAAAITLASFPDSTMLSWETTLHHSFSWDEFDSLISLDTPAARFVAETTEHTRRFLRSQPGIGYLLPDPLAMAVTLEPDLIRASQHAHVKVELAGRFTRGQCIIDHFQLSNLAPNVHIITELDTAGVLALYQRMLA